MIAARDPKPFPSFLPGRVGNTWYLARLWAVRRKGGKDEAAGFDAGAVLLSHFVALCITLMKEFGSLSQEHERLGQEKSVGKKQPEIWEKVLIASGRRVQCKLNIS